MKLNRSLATHLGVCVALFVGGGVVAKYLSAEAGVAMISLGTLLGGMLIRQPSYARSESKDA